MATIDPNQAPPTFKLVLVGDGGTGKVGHYNFTFFAPALLADTKEMGHLSDHD